MLYGFRESLLPTRHASLEPLIVNTYQIVLMRIPDLSHISEDKLAQLTDDFRTLSQLVNNPLLSFLDADLLFEIITRSIESETLQPRLQGVMMGFLYTFDKIQAKNDNNGLLTN